MTDVRTEIEEETGLNLFEDKASAVGGFPHAMLGYDKQAVDSYFQYLDQPVTGRWLDGENGHLGLVGITDVPWHDFVLSVARTNRDVLRQLRREAASVSTSGKSAD